MKKKLLIIPTILLAASLTACNLSFIDKWIGAEDEDEEYSEERSSSEQSESSSSSSSEPTGDILVSSITLEPDSLELMEGQTATLTATILPKNATLQTLDWSSSDTSIATVTSSGVVTAVSHGNAVIYAKSTDGGERIGACPITVNEESEYAIVKASPKYNYYDLSSSIISKYVAPTGEQKVLVIPTYFSDDTSKATEANRQFIEKSFFGTNDECGWRSFTGYYEEASYGQLHYSGYVCPTWYDSGMTKDYVKNNEDSSKTIASEALQWFKENNPTFDWTGYDADDDGFLDSLYIIYATDYIADTNLWGYRWTTTVASGDGLKASAFSWFSLKFLTNTSDYGGVPYGGSNTRIIIHEHGHMLGLEDYYDTAYSGMDLIGGFDMQDRNVLDWNSFSKYAVGWTQPYYVRENKLKELGSETITINAASYNGDCILVRNSEWNGSPFDEYILLELFNPDIGNNYYDSHYNSQSGISNIGYGIRMFHVDSRMAKLNWGGGGYSAEPTDEILPNYTFVPNDNTDPASDKHNHTGRLVGFTEWEPYHLLQMIQKENVNTFESKDSMARHEWQQSDLFQTGDTFCLGNHAGYENYGPEFFYNGSTFNDGSELPFGIEFLSVSKDSATIRFTYLD